MTKLTVDERQILGLLDNPTGRAGWPLSTWDIVRTASAGLIESGRVRERRLGSYPGLEITSAGRAALAGDQG